MIGWIPFELVFHLRPVVDLPRHTRQTRLKDIGLSCERSWEGIARSEKEPSAKPPTNGGKDIHRGTGRPTPRCKNLHSRRKGVGGKRAKLGLGSRDIPDHMEDPKVNPCEMRCVCMGECLCHVAKLEGHQGEEFRCIFGLRAMGRRDDPRTVPGVDQGHTHNTKIRGRGRVWTPVIEKQENRNPRLDKEGKVGPIGVGSQRMVRGHEGQRHWSRNAVAA